MLEIFLMKDRVNEKGSPFALIYEKTAIMLCVAIVIAIGIGLDLPPWGVAGLAGLSIGPIVYLYYYLFYIRPMKK